MSARRLFFRENQGVGTACTRAPQPRWVQRAQNASLQHAKCGLLSRRTPLQLYIFPGREEPWEERVRVRVGGDAGGLLRFRVRVRVLGARYGPNHSLRRTPERMKPASTFKELNERKLAQFTTVNTISGDHFINQTYRVKMLSCDRSHDGP